MQESGSTENPRIEPSSERVIPVIEEEVIIQSRKVERASILVDKKITTEDVTVDLPEISENYTIERIPKEQLLDEKPDIRYEGDSIIIPVTREVIVKRILLTEEIRLTREVREVQRKDTVTLRKEVVTVTRKEKENENESKQEY